MCNLFANKKSHYLLLLQQLVALLTSSPGGKGPVGLGPIPLPVGNPGIDGPRGPEGPIGEAVSYHTQCLSETLLPSTSLVMHRVCKVTLGLQVLKGIKEYL